MRENILFLVIDSLRADMCFGKNRKVKTPFIDSLARSGTSFIQAISIASTTSPCVTSMITGLYPFAHGVRTLSGYKLNSKYPTLAEILKRNGYYTCAMVTGPLSIELGLNKEFDEYIYRSPGKHIYAGFDRELREQIKKCKLRDPWFLFVHLFELHAPRQLLKNYDFRQYGNNFYERTLSCLDHHLKEIIENANLDNTMIILHGDHGERMRNRFFEIGARLKILQKLHLVLTAKFGRTNKFIQMGHGYHVYDYLVRVPLIFTGRKFPAGMKVDKQVGQIDIFPTIIDSMEIPFEDITRIHGRSLLPLIKGEAFEERPLYLEACGSVIPDEKNWLVGLRTPEWKFVFAPKNKEITQELYNLKEDPHESRNLIKREYRMAQRLYQRLLEIESLDLERITSEGKELSVEEREKIEEKLRRLGYM